MNEPLQARIMAAEAVERFGDSLIGQEVITARYGAWPGGLAEIIDMAPDPAAPDILFTVKGKSLAVQQAIFTGELESDEIGVLDNEEIVLLTPHALMVAAKDDHYEEQVAGVGGGD